MTMIRKTTPEPTSPNAAKAPMLWGHPLPTWTGPAGELEYHGEYWTPQRYALYVDWRRQVEHVLRTAILLGDETLERNAQQEISYQIYRQRWIDEHPGRPFGITEAFAFTKEAIAVELTTDEQATLQRRIDTRKAARDDLYQQAAAVLGPQVTSPSPRWEEVLRWAMGRPSMLVELGAMGIVPCVPDGVKP